jgi:hypothetical protein
MEDETQKYILGINYKLPSALQIQNLEYTPTANPRKHLNDPLVPTRGWQVKHHGKQGKYKRKVAAGTLNITYLKDNN